MAANELLIRYYNFTNTLRVELTGIGKSSINNIFQSCFLINVVNLIDFNIKLEEPLKNSATSNNNGLDLFEELKKEPQ